MITTGKDRLKEENTLDDGDVTSEALQLVDPNMIRTEAASSDRSKPEEPASPKAPHRDSTVWDFKARGEPFLWGLGGSLALGS